VKQGRVFILEGVNGTGKTTLSRALAEALSAVIIRPFHNVNPDSHWGQTLDPEERLLRAVGVPIQTPADDMYVADMLSKMKPSVAICDRSLITGMAYGDFDKDPRVHVKDAAREYWAGLLNKHHHTVLVHLTADYDTCVKRCAAEGRHKHREREEWDKLVGRYYTEVEMAGEYMDDVFHINTSTMETEEALKLILSAQGW
jgi:thymidylate kinase